MVLRFHQNANYLGRNIQYMGNTIFIKDRRVFIKPLRSRLEVTQQLKDVEVLQEW